MFGDTMQKIYMDGKDNLANCVPVDWEKPKKVMNHRSATRIVELANAIRLLVDTQHQQARSDAHTGTVRMFIISSSSDKQAVEAKVVQTMAELTEDNKWRIPEERKSFILEHHMAASRLGFSDLYVPLRDVDSFSTALLDGTLPELSLLSNRSYPC